MIKLKNLAIALMLLASSIVQAQSDLEKHLFELPDVIFTEIETPSGYEKAFKLMIKQPIDHKNPDMGHFYQKVYLSHKGFDRPTSIITNGYTRGSNNITEIARLTESNQLNVEHRYFGESVPAELDYEHLNFENVANDLHRIRVLFDEIYSGKWIATGRSKGGTTTIFYKYFFPDDVDASIPYVAPLNYDYEDKRIYEFLDNIGTQSCRDDLYDIQKDLLQSSDKAIDLLRWYVKGRGLNFNYLSLEEAYEFAVLELPFSFWQYGHDCSKIPEDENLNIQLDYLLEKVGLDFYSDKDMELFGPHYYQSANEMGYYGYETEDFKGLLKHLKYKPHPHAAFTPNKMDVKWEGDLTNSVAQWIKKNGNNMLYINGKLDTWSATAVPPSKDVNAHWFFMEGKSHADANVKNMTLAERKVFLDALSNWLGEKITYESKN